MALQGWPNLKIELDDEEGGTLVDISPFVRTINGWSVEAIVEEITGAGEDTDRWGAVGFTQKSEVTLGGPYDDQADGLVDITRNGVGETRTLRLTFDDDGSASDVITVETIITKAARTASAKALTQYAVTLRPTGAIS